MNGSIFPMRCAPGRTKRSVIGYDVRGMLAILILSIACCTADTKPTSDAQTMPDSFDLQGHRGARGLLPENTIPSFRKALELGVSTLEIDVVISADGQVVVSHDPLISATICSHPDGRAVTGEEQESLKLYEMPYEAIRQFDCGSRGHAGFPTQVPMPVYKPLLSDVFALGESWSSGEGAEPVRYNIEVKSQPDGDEVLHPEPDRFVSLVLQTVKEAGVENHVTIQSFDVRSLHSLHAQAPDITLALLIGRAEDRGLEENLRILGFTPQIYSPNYHLVDADLVAAVHAKEMRLIPWTVNESDAMADLIRLGVNGFITDYPDIAIQTIDNLSSLDQ